MEEGSFRIYTSSPTSGAENSGNIGLYCTPWPFGYDGSSRAFGLPCIFVPIAPTCSFPLRSIQRSASRLLLLLISTLIDIYMWLNSFFKTYFQYFVAQKRWDFTLELWKTVNFVAFPRGLVSTLIVHIYWLHYKEAICCSRYVLLAPAHSRLRCGPPTVLTEPSVDTDVNCVNSVCISRHGRQFAYIVKEARYAAL